MATANLLNDWLLVVCGHAKAPQRLGLCQVDVYVAAQKVGEDQLTNLILGVDHAAHEHLLKHCGAGSLLLRVCVYACMQRFAPAPRTVAGCTHTIKARWGYGCRTGTYGYRPVGLRLQACGVDPEVTYHIECAPAAGGSSPRRRSAAARARRRARRLRRRGCAA